MPDTRYHQRADGIPSRPSARDAVNVSRRLSQAISEGDGISLLVPVDDVEAARKAEGEGADGIVVSRELSDLREATALPVLCRLAALSTAVEVGADACLLRVEATGNGKSLADLYSEALSLGIEPVVAVRDDEELEFALDQVDPEIVLLSATVEEDDVDPVERVLALLPDVPAGKLAIAEVPVRTRDDVDVLETAGIDAVIVRSGDVAELVGGLPPEV